MPTINDQNEHKRVTASRLDDDYKALGLATTLMMTEAGFARLPFGFWSRILVGQIRRKHYLFFADGKSVTGFLGWARTTEAAAERWLAGEGEIGFEQSAEGDCILVNAWLAKTPRTHRAIVRELRRVGRDARLVYGKRYYKDGRVRPLRLVVNEFVDRHLSATTGDGAP